MISPNNLANFLDQYLQTAKYADEPPLVRRQFTHSVKRLGLALEAGPGLAEWAAAEKLDAVFLHRSLKLDLSALPEDIGVIASHLPFEEKLALGFNPRLAAMLGMTHPETLGDRNGRPLGMIGCVPPQTVAAFYQSVSEIFGGRDESRTCERNEVTKVAVVGAMTAELMHEASQRGAEVYVTGQMRKPAKEAIVDTGLGMVIVGHSRSEQWALSMFGNILRDRFCGLQVVLAKEPVVQAPPRLPKVME